MSRRRNSDSRGSGTRQLPARTQAGSLKTAVALHQQGQLEPAAAIYRDILRAQPDHADALHFLGLLESHQGHPDVAIDLISRSLARNPRNAAALCNRGNAFLELQSHEQALQDFQQALAIDPRMAAALNSRGNALQGLARHEEALASYQQALAQQPDYAEAFYNRGNALAALARHEEALASYEQALKLKPDYADALSNRGDALNAVGRPAEALVNFARALQLNATSTTALVGQAAALQTLGRAADALKSYDLALASEPGCAEALKGRGDTLVGLRRFDSALVSYEDGLKSNPVYPHLLGNWLHTKLKVCDWGGLDAGFTALAAGLAADQSLASPFAALGAPLPLSLQQKCAQLLIRDLFPPRTVAPVSRPAADRGRIRIGYFSADFYSHATAYLMAGLFEHHDRERFELFAFSFGPPVFDAMRTRLEAAFDRFIDVRSRSDTEIARLARDHGIDIAVDLKGFTQDARTGIFARRAAPLQVNYLGYPGTLGADYFDYVIADPTLIPAQHRPYYTEKVAYLPHSYQCNDSTRAIAGQTITRQQAGLPEHGFVFCCFNNNWKITPEVFDIWMRLLGQVENSVLWLFEDNPLAGANLRAQAEKRGVLAQRLVFAPRMANPEHLARHRLADLFLDTLPYNAHTTASDALWAGLPVLTRCGETFAGRVATSLLQAVGLPELVTHSPEDYQALALKLASDPRDLASLRQRLAEQRLHSPLFDTPRFARHLEAAYSAMWQRHRDGLPPDHIFVTP